MTMVEIKKWVKPDIQLILQKQKREFGASEYNMYSVLFKDNLLAICDCDPQGSIKHYSTTKFYALRINTENDIIQVCIPKYGWVCIYEEIQNKYNDTIAEMQLLGK